MPGYLRFSRVPSIAFYDPSRAIELTPDIAADLPSFEWSLKYLILNNLDSQPLAYRAFSRLMRYGTPEHLAAYKGLGLYDFSQSYLAKDGQVSPSIAAFFLKEEATAPAMVGALTRNGDAASLEPLKKFYLRNISLSRLKGVQGFLIRLLKNGGIPASIASKLLLESIRQNATSLFRYLASAYPKPQGLEDIIRREGSKELASLSLYMKKGESPLKVKVPDYAPLSRKRHILHLIKRDGSSTPAQEAERYESLV